MPLGFKRLGKHWREARVGGDPIFVRSGSKTTFEKQSWSGPCNNKQGKREEERVRHTPTPGVWQVQSHALGALEVLIT